MRKTFHARVDRLGEELDRRGTHHRRAALIEMTALTMGYASSNEALSDVGAEALRAGFVTVVYPDIVCLRDPAADRPFGVDVETVMRAGDKDQIVLSPYGNVLLIGPDIVDRVSMAASMMQRVRSRSEPVPALSPQQIEAAIFAGLRAMSAGGEACVEAAEDVARLFLPTPRGGGDSYFVDKGRSALVGFLIYLAVSGRLAGDEGKSSTVSLGDRIRSLIHQMDGDPGGADAWLRRFMFEVGPGGRYPQTRAYRELSALCCCPDKERSGILGTVLQALLMRGVPSPT